jgi:uncharacterized protein (DUF2235 family)
MKKLVLCCDGTWNRADQEKDDAPTPTNVVKLAYRVAKRDGPTLQVVYYHQGVGTGNAVDRYSGGAFGDGLEENIHDAYRFLIANYETGDEVYLFGFSRGAYTARSLAGMIRKCGVLKRAAVRQYRAALDLYRSSQDGPDSPKALAFKGANAIDGPANVPIHFIGVWDTVGALGIPLRGLRSLTRQDYQFHDTALSGSVRFAYHALAIDEHRAPFEPTLWQALGKPGQTMEQVWFCGAHSDVGGGYPETGLSDQALDWMLAKAKGAGLALDETAIAALPLHPEPKGKLHDSKTGLYNLTKGIDRPIGVVKDPKTGALADDPTQSLHESVTKRWDADAGYRPATLKAYFKKIGDPRGA